MEISNNSTISKNQNDAIDKLISQAKQNFHRYPVLLSGDKSWRHEFAYSLQQKYSEKSTAWISKTAPNSQSNLSNLKAGDLIGKEFDCIFYDMEQDFSPNLFAAISGTLRAGGMFFILCPPLNIWRNILSETDKFLWRISTKLAHSEYVIKIKQGEEEQTIISNFANTKQIPYQSKQDQELAVNNIIQVANGHRNRPLVLWADRGRGKSASLGIAAAKLLINHNKKVIITAPSRDACHIAFKHFTQEINEQNHDTNDFKNIESLEFIAPDKLISTLPKTNLLIIDEAAGIPVPMLEKITQHYSRIIFASTIHGYEGSGHCFSNKFFKILDKTKPGWKQLQLAQPIRWNNNDPLEILTNQLFLLKPKALYNQQKPVDLRNIKIELISTQELVNDELLLSEFYALLSAAHYKTQPSDLEQIINNPNIQIYIIRKDSLLLAAAFTIKETQIEKTLSNEIYLGNRRIKGQFIPQSLLMHLGIKSAGELIYLRITRVAVLPEFQSNGLGSFLIENICEKAAREEYDFIGCTFGISNELLRFWQKQQFSLVRIGHHKTSKSNAYAALMLKPISDNCLSVFNQAITHFCHNFPYQLRESLNVLNDEITLSVFKHYLPKTPINITKNEWECLNDYSTSNRTYEDNIEMIYKCSLFTLSKPATHDLLKQNELRLILLKSIYGKSWKDIAKILKFTGKQQTISRFNDTIFKILSHYQP